jgi:hypothetical protein
MSQVGWGFRFSPDWTATDYLLSYDIDSGDALPCEWKPKISLGLNTMVIDGWLVASAGNVETVAEWQGVPSDVWTEVLALKQNLKYYPPYEKRMARGAVVLATSANVGAGVPNKGNIEAINLSSPSTDPLSVFNDCYLMDMTLRETQHPAVWKLTTEWAQVTDPQSYL